MTQEEIIKKLRNDATTQIEFIVVNNPKDVLQNLIALDDRFMSIGNKSAQEQVEEIAQVVKFVYKTQPDVANKIVDVPYLSNVQNQTGNLEENARQLGFNWGAALVGGGSILALIGGSLAGADGTGGTGVAGPGAKKEEPKKDNTLMYVVLGLGGLAVVIGLIVYFSPKKEG
jgi:hypothetical protein